MCRKTHPMSRLWLLALLGCLLPPLPSFAASLSGQVIAVPDAYRIILHTENGRRLPIVLLGLAVPGSANPQWRKTGRRHLRMLLSGHFVTVDYTGRDKQGVILGVVRHGGADIGLRLLHSGLAVIHDHTVLSSELKGAYLRAEQEARRRGMGYWQNTR
jgi:endonuclease YncB( thermonuclease family)